MLNTLAFIGMQEGMIVLIAILVLFGGKKIPELMRGVGQGVGELKKGMEEGQRQVHEAIKHDEPVAPVTPVTTAPTVSNTTTNS